jgi:hypothetical protein
MSDTSLFPAWKQAVRTLLGEGLTYGSVVSRKRIAELCEVHPPRSIEDVRRHDLELLTAITEIKDSLLTAHCMLLVADNKGSFVVIAPESQTGYAVHTGVKAINKEMRKMAMAVSFTRTELLSNSDRAKNADAQAKISMLSGMMRVQNKELQQIADKERHDAN